MAWGESRVGVPEGSAPQLTWAARTGLPAGEPWCASFVSNAMLANGIHDLPPNPNYVPSYEQDWRRVDSLRIGDLVAFAGRHIGIYVGDGEMVSGNSSDAVSLTPLGRPTVILRPPYRPPRVRTIGVSQHTALTTPLLFVLPSW